MQVKLVRSDPLRCLASVVLGFGVAAGAAAQPAPLAPSAEGIVDAMARADAAILRIAEIPDGQRTFRNTVEAIDDVLARFELDTNMTQFMAHVSTDPAERDAGRAAEEEFTNWLIGLGKNEELYRAVKAFADTKPRLDPLEQRLLDHTLRDYRRSGMALDPVRREKLTGIQKQITSLSIAFDTNINEDNTRIPLARDELSGMPDDFFDRMEKHRVGDVYMVSMAYPEFLPVMDRCDDETTRRKMWITYKRRAAPQNVAVLEQILELRAEAAGLLGYAHPADYEIEVRMAKDAETVMAFYRKLRPLVRRKAEMDYRQLLESKRAHVGSSEDEIHPWDTSFYTNRVLKDRYEVDSELVKEYFPLEKATRGLFDITQSLYGITYTDVTAKARAAGRRLWHETVQLFEVHDDETGEKLGEFYLDLFPRDYKYGHAAQWGLAQHKVWAEGEITRPVAALVCNFPEPAADRPSLLTHDQVETYFHEFGHCLHTILSESRFWQQAGTNVERDFVEAPSQMFENWVWDAGVLATFACHYRTGEPLPAGLLGNMIEARYLGSGMLAERQFFYGLFDMSCHLERSGRVDTTKLAEHLWDPSGENVELYDPVPGTYFQAAFGHLTGYQAGYYGYQWSLVYACDMFQRFKELGMLDPEAGRYYRKKILARGGTMDGLDLVRDYLGREPDMGAYLKHLGLE